MNGEWFYKGLYRVRVVTESEGYCIIEALEEFEDDVAGDIVKVKVGEQRIVPSDTICKLEYCSPPINKSPHKFKLEKKLKKLISEEKKEH